MPSLTVLDQNSERAMIKAYVAHVPLRDIAHEYHVGHTRLMQMLREQGVYHAQVPTFDAANVVLQERRTDRDARILAMWEQRMPVLNISDQMGLTRDLVKNVLRRAGYSFPNAHGQKTKVLRCRCCEIVLAESGDARHAVTETGEVCGDCAERYEMDSGRWVRRRGFVLERVPLPVMVDCQAGLGKTGWAMIEEES